MSGRIGGTGVRAGLLAGTIGILCCVGPTVAALLGLTSAAVAVDLANDLYSDWGWAFKLAGRRHRGRGVLVGTPTGGVVPGRRTPEPHAVRDRLSLVGTGVLTYLALYALTTWLGTL